MKLVDPVKSHLSIMRFAPSLVLLPAVAQAVNIVSSNDDGWAEINIRALYESLSSAGHDVLVSAPAENKSGSGMQVDLISIYITE